VAYTFNTRWLEAFRSGAEVAVLATIRYTSGGDEVTYCHNPRGHPLFGYPNLIADMVPISQDLDVLESEIRMGSIDITLLDHDEIRDLISTYPLRNKRVIVQVGTPDLVEGDFEEVFRGVILAQPATSPTHHTIAVGDTFGLMVDRNLTGAFIGDFPGEILETIMDTLVDDATTGLIDNTSFSPAPYTNDISHFNVARAASRFGIQAVTDPTSALTLKSELEKIMRATVTVNRDGVLELRRPNLSGSSVATFTTNDFSSLSVSEISPINRVETLFDYRGEERGQRPPVESAISHRISEVGGDVATEMATLRELDAMQDALDINAEGNRQRAMMRAREFRQSYIRDDAVSQAAFAYNHPAGRVDRIYSWEMASKWIGPHALLRTTINAGDGAGATFDLEGVGLAGFCGLAGFDRATGIPANQRASAARPVYVKIDREIIACDLVTPDLDVETVNGWSNYIDGLDVYPRPGSDHLVYKATFRILSRAALGTTGGVAHAPYDGGTTVWTSTQTPTGFAWDVTIPEFICREILDRFANGAPVASFLLPLEWGWLELRDIIRLVHPKLLSYGYDGIDATTPWEIIGLEADWMGATPGIRVSALPAVVGKAGAGAYQHQNTDTNDAANAGWISEAIRSFWHQYLNSGFVVSGNAALNFDIAEGAWGRSAGGVGRVRGDTAIAVQANKDTYTYLDRDTGLIVKRQTALAAGDPGEFAGLERVAKVVSNGADTTTTPPTDQRKMSAVAFGVWDNTGAKALVAGGWVRVDFDTVEINVGIPAGSATAAFTAPYAGVWEFYTTVEVLISSAAGTSSTVAFFVNAAASKLIDNVVTHVVGQTVRQSGSALLQLAQGDVVDVRAFVSGGGAGTITAGQQETWFQGRRAF